MTTEPDSSAMHRTFYALKTGNWMLTVGCVLGLLAWQILAGRAIAQPPPVPPEPPDFPNGVLRAWVERGGEMGTKPENRRQSFGYDDTLVVEVKNFNGWLVELADTLHFVDEDLMKNTSEMMRVVIRNGCLKLVLDANQVIQSTKGGGLTDSQIEVFITGNVLTTEDKSEIIRLRKEVAKTSKLPRYPLNPGVEGLSTEDVVSEVLKLPKYRGLAHILGLENGIDSKAALLFHDAERLIKQLLSKKASELRLLINDLELTGVSATNPNAEFKTSRPGPTSNDNYFWYYFPITENAENTTVWQQLRKRILLDDSIHLTLNCPYAGRTYPLRTSIKYVPKGSQPKEGFYEVRLVIISQTWLVLALTTMAVCLIIFISCAVKTDLIRDTQGDLRPDGILPHSLARAQMAFWFILVVGSFHFLYISLNKVPELNNTCLWLIGIGAGTALGAAVISEDRNKTGGGLNAWPLKRNEGEKRLSFMKRLENEIATRETAMLTNKEVLQAEIMDLKQVVKSSKSELARIEHTDLPALKKSNFQIDEEISTSADEAKKAEGGRKASLQSELKRKRKELSDGMNRHSEYEKRITSLASEIPELQAKLDSKEKLLALTQRTELADFHAELDKLKDQLRECNLMRGNPVMRLLKDWLDEYGHYSFHRYQMLIWTFVLGVVFIFTVIKTRSLPVFDDTLLALLGISNGTYLGFHLPSIVNNDPAVVKREQAVAKK